MLMSVQEYPQAAVYELVTIRRPAAEISDFACDSRYVKWHSLIDSASVDSNGTNCKFEIAGGDPVAEMPIKKGDKTHIISIVHPKSTVLPVANYQAHYMVAPINSESSIVKWRAVFDSLSSDAHAIISSMFATGLIYLKKDLEA